MEDKSNLFLPFSVLSLNQAFVTMLLRVSCVRLPLKKKQKKTKQEKPQTELDSSL